MALIFILSPRDRQGAPEPRFFYMGTSDTSRAFILILPLVTFTLLVAKTWIVRRILIEHPQPRLQLP